MAAMAADCRVWEDVGVTWSEALREVEALDWLHKNSTCSSSHSHGVPLRENKSSKVVSDGIEKIPLGIHSLLGEISASVPGNGISHFMPSYCRGDLQRLQRKACWNY